jgi:hypothetical protein
VRIEVVSWETVSGLRSVSSKSALNRGWFTVVIGPILWRV